MFCHGAKRMTQHPNNTLSAHNSQYSPSNKRRPSSSAIMTASLHSRYQNQSTNWGQLDSEFEAHSSTEPGVSLSASLTDAPKKANRISSVEPDKQRPSPPSKLAGYHRNVQAKQESARFLAMRTTKEQTNQRSLYAESKQSSLDVAAATSTQVGQLPHITGTRQQHSRSNVLTRQRHTKERAQLRDMKQSLAEENKQAMEAMGQSQTLDAKGHPLLPAGTRVVITGKSSLKGELATIVAYANDESADEHYVVFLLGQAARRHRPPPFEWQSMRSTEHPHRAFGCIPISTEDSFGFLLPVSLCRVLMHANLSPLH